MAKGLMEDVSILEQWWYKDHADGMVSGAAHTTQHNFAYCSSLKQNQSSVVSSIFFMCLEDRVSVLEIVLLIQILLRNN
jgi:phosphate acetyltransferase